MISMLDLCGFMHKAEAVYEMTNRTLAELRISKYVKYFVLTMSKLWRSLLLTTAFLDRAILKLAQEDV